MEALRKGGFYMIVVLVAVFLICGWNVAQAAEKKMSYEEYKSQLAAYAKRESTAVAAITEIEKGIASLSAEIKEIEQKIAAVTKEIYELIESDEAGVEAFKTKLKRLKSQIEGLTSLPSDQLYKKRDEVEALGKDFAELKANPITYLPDVAEEVVVIDGMLARLKAAVPKVAPPDYYTVVRGDCLWTISAKEKIYGDPYMWPRIYRANKDKIKNPDLIYPNWVLTIPRGVPPGYHLVIRGEWLSKIAGYGHIYNDPSKWTKIYEANKDQIKDPNLIFPAQLLAIPEE